MSWSASALAAHVGGRLQGDDRPILGVAPLESAGPGDLAFAERAVPARCAAEVLIVREPVEGRTCVVVADPRLAFARALQHLFPEAHRPGVHTGAHVDPTARIGEGAAVYPGAWVGPGCVVGEGSVIYPNAVLYPGTIVGKGCRVHAGAVIGADGFSYAAGPDGAVKMPQVGRARLGDGVEVGANTCVDRGALGETVVGDGSKLDNLVQVGHNCRLGRSVLVAGQAGLSGSVEVGDGAVLGGQVGVADHARIGAGARVAAQTGLSGKVEGGEAWLGTPAMPIRLGRRVYALLKRLPEMMRRIERLEEGGGPDP